MQNTLSQDSQNYSKGTDASYQLHKKTNKRPTATSPTKFVRRRA